MGNTKVTIGDPAENVEEAVVEVEETESEDLQLDKAFVEIIDPAEEPVEMGMTVEDLDPEEELWPGGPSAGKIIEWKKEHGDVYVTSITMEQHVIWRTMNRFEYKNHVKNVEKLGQTNQISQADISMLNEELIAEMCILFPKFDRSQLGQELAGVPSIIAQEVMEASGFVALEVRQL